jgi:transcriptional regulator with XRE-family HTH domain
MYQFNNIAVLIRNYRMMRKPKLSQQELGSRLGYDNGQLVSNLERALCSMPVKKLFDASCILGIPKDELKRAMVKDYEQRIDDALRER